MPEGNVTVGQFLGALDIIVGELKKLSYGSPEPGSPRAEDLVLAVEHILKVLRSLLNDRLSERCQSRMPDPIRDLGCY